MAKDAIYHVPFRRRRDGKTNFHRRMQLIVSEKNRLVVRRSNKHDRVSIVRAKSIGDETLVNASSAYLKDYGWKTPSGNVPSAYLTGYLAGKYAEAVGIKDAILDIGVNSCRKSTRISAMLCGAVHAGLNIPHDPEVFPSEDRFSGKTIAEYAAKLKKDNVEKYNKQFSQYIKQSLKPESLPTYFNTTLKAINSETSTGTLKTKLANRNKKNKAAKASRPKIKVQKPKPAPKDKLALQKAQEKKKVKVSKTPSKPEAKLVKVSVPKKEVKKEAPKETVEPTTKEEDTAKKTSGSKTKK